RHPAHADHGIHCFCMGVYCRLPSAAAPPVTFSAYRLAREGRQTGSAAEVHELGTRSKTPWPMRTFSTARVRAVAISLGTSLTTEVVHDHHPALCVARNRAPDSQ